mmetsp:Transcript_11337/g.13390  ORF Transcript_11337/g.13390 Transcript_11337/m.13390 type:complete len:101 (+) Transcript_11337:101-403(+)|eukprot:CAMPEP_0198248948 /NCGR_PEP_ID=MMETSP1447-20131203/593_1 /TAXON_ID=420782 /ORGANISM="Chaetoceros dichaeta, Strain CCMP1751" /LENGTH=100 /DNA_ID=CAMNT_0043933455 /DNA_START=78 /DNA_END=380 /DNA_ORIENTATION=+
MARLSLILTLVVTVLAISANAFAPSATVSKKTFQTSLNEGFGMPDEDVKPLTRDNEPDEFFSSKMDKMDDGEKMNVALLGLAGISLPFVAGLIALYAASG